MGRRSPGRRGGREVGDEEEGGRRWKIGWPGTGRPGMGRPAIGIPGVGGPGAGRIGAAAAGGRIGALYTGRGPVCGTIMRGAGAAGGGGGGA